ncbi:hypothetical protein [Chengkuizengella sediminis]|uniref:hypothetical protein n=1 Tax=Chengkuizengella sediminis TaxID=1885917 RepID=UPI00138A0D7F|nr:hypothetical protein [Chengkuizengella sediminis]NDI36663.1 hypothetical protein [Chengkuizengella sediminis]
MEIEVIDIGVEIHVTPLEKVFIEPSLISVEFDDVDENRWRISFNPCQGFKMTTIDCIDTKLLLVDGKRPCSLLKVNNSRWIKELKNVLKQKDHTANFMDESNHYIFPFQDNIIEVAAMSSFKVENID